MMDEKLCCEILGVSKQIYDEELRRQYGRLLNKIQQIFYGCEL